jgi:hypothetical protein
MIREPPEYRAAHLQEALATDPRVNEPSLRVSVGEDAVRVTGDVPTPERRDAVTEVLRELCPDLRVDNRTVLRTPSDEPSEERL